MTAWPELARAIAGFGLPGAKLALPRSPVDAKTWAHSISCVGHERITGLLVQGVSDGAIALTDEQAADVARGHRSAMTAAVRLERALVLTAARLDDAGISTRVLKGSAVAHLDYPDPALRSFGDIDLLVRPEQFDAAVDVLVGAGCSRRFPEPRPGFDRRFGKGVCLVAPDGHQLDLHRTLAAGPFGLTIGLDDLWAAPSPFALAGRPFLALGPEERFLHACIHAALGSTTPRLATLRDIAQMSLRLPLDVERVRVLSAGWRVDAAVARALRLAWEALALEPVGPLVEWAVTYQPSPRDSRALAVYTGQGRSYAGQSFAALRAVRGTRDKAAFAFALGFPRRSYLHDQREGAARRWRRGLAQVLRSKRRAQ